MGGTDAAYKVVACIAMVYIAIAYIVMAHIFKAHILMGYIPMAPKVMAYIVMTYRHCWRVLLMLHLSLRWAWQVFARV